MVASACGLTAKDASLAQSLVVPLWEVRVPLHAAVAEGSRGKLPKTQSGVSVSRSGVLVTALGQNPDGQGTLLRVWDQSGEAGELTVTLPGNSPPPCPSICAAKNPANCFA